MDRDVKTIKRQVYNSFMLIGDVGGFYSLFVSISVSILSVINYNKSENLLIGDLFKANDQT